jgi:hypothetical protein
MDMKVSDILLDEMGGGGGAGVGGRTTAQNTTVDMKPDTLQKNAAKQGNTITKDGIPPLVTNTQVKMDKDAKRIANMNKKQKTKGIKIEAIVKKLTELGYRDIKEPKGNYISVLVPYEKRKETLKHIAENLDPEAILYPLPSNASSIGHVKLDEYKILAKPINKQGAFAPGLMNELILIQQVNAYLKEHGTIDIEFAARNKKLLLKNVHSVTGLGRTNAKGNRADIIFHGDQDYPISIKKADAENWAKIETYWGARAKVILDDLVNKGEIELKQIDHYYRVNREIAVKPTEQDKEFVAFGKDNAKMVQRSFENQDFKMVNDKTLRIKADYVATDLSDLTGKHDVWFLIRNDKTRNPKDFLPGLTLSAVYPIRVAATTVKKKLYF